MFDIEKFMTYMKETFGPMDNRFIYNTVENLVRYAVEHESHTKDSLCYFLSDMIDELEFCEVAMFEDDNNLTPHGRKEKYDAIESLKCVSEDVIISILQETKGEI